MLSNERRGAPTIFSALNLCYVLLRQDVVQTPKHNLMQLIRTLWMVPLQTVHTGLWLLSAFLARDVELSVQRSSSVTCTHRNLVLLTSSSTIDGQATRSPRSPFVAIMGMFAAVGRGGDKADFLR